MISPPEMCILSSLEEAGVWGWPHVHPDGRENVEERSDPRTIESDNGKTFLFPQFPVIGTDLNTWAGKPVKGTVE